VTGGVRSRLGLAVVLVSVAWCVSVALSGASAAAADFGLQSFAVGVVNRDGTPDVQAGSHPYGVTTSFVMNELEEFKVGTPPFKFLASGGGIKDVEIELPPGFVGDPNAAAKCAYVAFLQKKCPDDAVVGEATTGIAEVHGFVSPLLGRRVANVEYYTNPVYNVEPPGGVAAELGFVAGGAHPVLADASVRTGRDYGITVTSRSVTEAIVAYSVKVTIWGVPAETSHDPVRGKCLGEAPSDRYQTEVEGVPHDEEESLGVCPAGIPARPFLTNPTSCGTPRVVTVKADSWDAPGNFSTGENVVSKSAELPELTGCEALNFSPTLTVAPDGSAGSTPTGLNLSVKVPQEATTNPAGLGEADMRDTTVTLPAGVLISPSAADGLQACSLLHGSEPGKETEERERRLVGINLESSAPANCPEASKLATVRVRTPLLEHELEGAVYLATPQQFGGPLENPFGDLTALYLVAEEPETGVLVKLAGMVNLNQETGQLTATFENVPQFPVNEVKLAFFGSDRAPLTTPALCGTYTTTTAFVPWSAGEDLEPSEVAHPASSFTIASGPNGSPECGLPLPFRPSLTAGSTNVQAGAFSPLTTTISREDGQQSLQGVQLHLPPGLLGTLSSVTPCEEPQADEGTCGSSGLIGETTVGVGLGSDPYTVTGGRVYITGPYHGAPYGLSIVNPAKAGPFDLEHTEAHHPACDCLVVRAKVEVNPITSVLSVTANSGSEPYAIPTMLEGIPLQIKHINVTVNRAGFTFNPTNCNKLQLEGTLTSAEGAVSPLNVPFQVTNCAALAFKPTFAASTAAHNTRTGGASLTTTVTYPNGPQGTEADIAKVKVSLPARLPARLTTLQKACPEKTFAENPAGCPAAARIGEATTRTPVLPTPLSGPAFFVSHGGAKYPELVIELKGDNVTIDLHGETAISKKGVLTSTFNEVPDAPFSSFELNLPEGPYSALTANSANLCKGALMIPTELTAQNGAVIKQNTTIKVTGCPKKRTKLTRKTKTKKASETNKKTKK
jgi:hypothetical protein